MVMELLVPYLRDAKRELAALHDPHIEVEDRCRALEHSLRALLCAVWELAGQPDLRL